MYVIRFNLSVHLIFHLVNGTLNQIKNYFIFVANNVYNKNLQY